MPKPLQELASFLDEDKIVTYKWLSKQVNISASESKELLETYLKRNKTGGFLTAIYCLIGFEKKLPTSAQANQRVLLVREDDLAKVKSQLHTVSSQHVYSLQKAIPKNSNSIYIVDSEAGDRHHTFRVKENVENSRQKPQQITQKTQPEKSQPQHLQKPELQQKQSRPQPLKEIKPKVEIKRDEKTRDKETVLTKLRNAKPKATKKVKLQNEPPTNKHSKKKPEIVKRKRLRPVSSSSSESEKDDEENEESVLNFSPEKEVESEDPIATPPNEPAEITLRQQQEINQSFVDDDGYLVTTKVRKVVEEKVMTTNTATIKEKKVSQPIARGKKKLEQHNNKQATLMSYFKKS